MKKLFLLSFTFIFTFSVGFSQVTDKEEDLKKISADSTDGWETGGIFSITFGQSSFSNWSAGGTNSLSLNGLAGLTANFKKGKLTWDNTLDLGYGIQKLGSGDESQQQKTDDKLDFSSKLGYKAIENLYYAALVNFKTQFTEGFEYPDDSTVISNFMAPGYLLGAVGIDYKPFKSFSIFIAPITSKTTFVNNTVLSDAGAFGVEPGEKIKNEFGGYIKTVFSKEIVKNVNLTTKLDLFYNYIDSKELTDTDVNWEVLIGMKVNEFITANISTQLLWDTDVLRRGQFKEIFGIGFSYKF